MITQTINIGVIPHPQMRPKFARMGKHVVAYKDKRQQERESILISELIKYKPAIPYECPIYVHFKAFLPVPLSKPKKWKEAALQGTVQHITKPDVDNLLKFLLDCMKECGYFHDDSQIYAVVGEKQYSLTPRWEITIHYSQREGEI